MKKLLVLLVGLVALAGFFYFYYSTPKVLERRLDSLLGTMNFGLVNLKDADKVADKFASHFADEVTFSGSGNDIITGKVSPADMKELYSGQFRPAAKSSQAKTTGDTVIEMKSSVRAQMDTTIQLDLVLRDNMSYPRKVPARFIWEKNNGKWVISEVQLQESVDDFSF